MGAVLALAASLAVGCGGDGGLRVQGVWARPSPAMADAGAVYLEVTSPVADRLVGVSVDPSVAGVAEIHETVTADSGAGEGMGAMTMRPAEGIDLPAGETISLRPGSYHIMLMMLPAPLEAGGTFDVTLSFEQAGEVTVQVEVRDEAP